MPSTWIMTVVYQQCQNDQLRIAFKAEREQKKERKEK